MSFNANNLSRVTLLKNPNYKKNGLKSYVSLLQKYNIGPTIEGPFRIFNQINQNGAPAIHAKFGKRVGGKAIHSQVLMKKDPTGSHSEVSAQDVQQDSMYLAPVGIGSPAQNLKLDFDTGSADLWCWSTELPSNVQAKGKQNGHTIFDPSKSSTWKKSSGESWQIQYGDGLTASGDVGTDTLIIGGLTIHGQAIETANQMSSQFQQGSGDGLLGLAFGSINTVQPTPVQTPVENMISQQDIPNAAQLFTAYLGSWRDTKAADKGESFYTFGYIDQDVVKASGQEINYVAVDNSQGFWQFPSTSASVNGQTIARGGNSAIADTGTTLALVDDTTCEAIYKAIPGAKQDQSQQGWVLPAATTADRLPIVQFAVGSKLFAVPKESLSFADAGNGMVYGGIQSRGDMTFDILGNSFLKGIYAIFDQGNTRFGCVQRKDQTQNTISPPAPAEGSGGES